MQILLKHMHAGTCSHPDKHKITLQNLCTKPMHSVYLHALNSHSSYFNERSSAKSNNDSMLAVAASKGHQLAQYCLAGLHHFAACMRMQAFNLIWGKRAVCNKSVLRLLSHQGYIMHVETIVHISWTGVAGIRLVEHCSKQACRLVHGLLHKCSSQGNHGWVVDYSRRRKKLSEAWRWMDLSTLPVKCFDLAHRTGASSSQQVNSSAKIGFITWQLKLLRCKFQFNKV